jgi:hypothetical protein
MNRYNGGNNVYGYQGRTNNNLLNQYNDKMKNNTPFQNNPMLSNNPVFIGSVRDPKFYDRINVAKLNKLKTAKDINDLGMNKKELTDYIINPMKIEKLSKDELLELSQKYNVITDQFPKLPDKKENKKLQIQKKTMKNDKEIFDIEIVMQGMPKILKEWWNSRTNDPYKNILKNLKDTNKKKYKNKEDFIVHKVSNVDKSEVMLEKEYEDLMALLEMHNNNLKVIYSASEKNKHKQEFRYINKYKYRLKYDPKNFEELKDYYKSEEKKLQKNNKQLDDLIDSLIDEDILDDEQKKELTKQLQNIEVEMETKRKSKIEKIEDQLRNQLGDSKYKQIMREVEKQIEESSSESEPDNKERRKEKPNKKMIKDKNDSDEKPNKKMIKDKNDSDEKPKQGLKMIVSSSKNNDKKEFLIGQVSKNEIDKYKKKKK